MSFKILVLCGLLTLSLGASVPSEPGTVVAAAEGTLQDAGAETPAVASEGGEGKDAADEAPVPAGKSEADVFVTLKLEDKDRGTYLTDNGHLVRIYRVPTMEDAAKRSPLALPMPVMIGRSSLEASESTNSGTKGPKARYLDPYHGYGLGSLSSLGYIPGAVDPLYSPYSYGYSGVLGGGAYAAGYSGVGYPGGYLGYPFAG